MDLIWLLLYLRPKYSIKMIFAFLDVSLIMNLNVGETDKVFYINICCFYNKNSTKFGFIISFCGEDMTKIT